ncbi:hypothetical protein GCM10009802_57360 [Streptomyces synnematoformans]|uniref:Uncharacterized protein n=1 Tax=Streptomyces synnematoformans TaxID=415721 RepID=A0ABP4KHQ4_9ACTN
MHGSVEVPPWRPEMGRRPLVKVYPARGAPRLRVRVDSAWRSSSLTTPTLSGATGRVMR